MKKVLVFAASLFFVVGITSCAQPQDSDMVDDATSHEHTHEHDGESHSHDHEHDGDTTEHNH